MQRQRRWRALGASLVLATAAGAAVVGTPSGLAGAQTTSSLGVINVPGGDIMIEGYYRLQTVAATGTAATGLEITQSDALGNTFKVNIAPKTGGTIAAGVELGTEGTATASAARLVVAQTAPVPDKVCDAPKGQFDIDDVAFGGGGGQVSQLAMTWRLACDSLPNDPVSSGYLYFAEPNGPIGNPASGEFVPMSPKRLLDTRDSAPLGPAGTVNIQVAGGSSGVPADAMAVVLNITGISPSVNTFLTAFPAGSSRPLVSNVNPAVNDIVPNLSTVKVGDGGNVVLYNELGTTHAAVDVMGYYQPTAVLGGFRFVGQNPNRLLDTRLTGGPLAAGESRELTVDATAEAAVLNVTLTEGTAPTYITVSPAGEAVPLTSNLNGSTGQTIPNLVIVKLTAGKANIFNAAGNANVVVDLVGLFKTAGSAPDAGRFVPITPARAYDSRTPLIPGQIVGQIGPGSSRDLGLLGMLGSYPFEYEGWVGNVTVTATTAQSFLTVYPTGSGRPFASNLNWLATETRPNLVMARTDAFGFNTFYNEVGNTDLIVDIGGFFTR